MKLDELLVRLGNDDTVLVKGTNLATAGDLKAALLRQSSIYLRLSALGAPQSTNDHERINAVLLKLIELKKNVVDLETRAFSDQVEAEDLGADPATYPAFLR
jgi:hypothetical protein